MLRLLRSLLCLCALLVAGVGEARAAGLEEALAALAAAPTGAPRVEAAQAVIALGPAATDAMIARLGQPRASKSQEIRHVLARFRAQVPDEKGSFQQPPRPPKGGAPAEPDWLAELANINGREQAVLDALEVVTIIRALAATGEVRAADAILELAFSSAGIVYRDECGRALRTMSPRSLPTLLRASGDRKRAGGTLARYAAYQLDRLEKGRPEDALAAAPDDSLEVVMLQAIAAVRHPDAVYAVMARVNDPSHAVREAARAAWLAYVTGPPPPPAPKRPRKMPGGKMSEPLPVYLTYRELATEELRRVLTELQGAPPPRGKDPEVMTRELFALRDQESARRWDEKLAQANRAVSEGRPAEAVAIYDAILEEDPLFIKRAEMAGAYLEVGRQHAKAADWAKAAAAIDRALSVDPKGSHAREIDAELHYARAQLARSQGKNPDNELGDALAQNPKLPAARALLAQRAQPRHRWRLATGLGTSVAALALVGCGLLLRRRSRTTKPATR